MTERLAARKRFCVRGHDTWETGRFRSGTCKACQPLYETKRKVQRRGEDQVASLPLRRLIRNRKLASEMYRSTRQVTERSADRAVAYLFSHIWIDTSTADIWCIVLGWHLSELYPELYAEEASA